MVNPFTGVSREEFETLQQDLATATSKLADSQREANSLRIELSKELQNGERLSEFLHRAVLSIQVLEQTLVERQIGKDRDPSLCLVVNTFPQMKKATGFRTLKRRKRDAAKRLALEETRRNALPTLTAQLPELPLTKHDREVLSTAMKENL